MPQPTRPLDVPWSAACRRRVRRVVVKHEEVACVAPVASPLVQYTEAGKVVVPFGSSGDPRQRVWFGLKTEIVSAM